MLILDGRRARPTSKKNRCLVLAGASQGGETRREIPHDPPSFSLAAIMYTCILLQGKKFNFSYGYPCHWKLKLHQFLCFVSWNLNFVTILRTDKYYLAYFTT